MSAQPKGVLLDVDGTLYRQRPIRTRMALELVHFALKSPVAACRAARILRTFRSERERLRATPSRALPLERLQYQAAAERLGVDAGEVESLVAEWMLRRPLPHLRAAMRAGLEGFLEACRRRGVLVAAWSDYPTRDKVAALGLSRWFQLHLCSTDPEVGTFKPAPQGVEEACRRWGLEPGEILCVGDRVDVDGEAARTAGARFVLVGRGRGADAAVRDFRELTEYLAWEEV